MYNTHLILPPQLNDFDFNLISKFEHYVFVIVPSSAEYEIALKRFAPVLAASDALCFLIEQTQLSVLAEMPVLASLFNTACSTTPKNAVSYIAAISRKELLGTDVPKGAWFELYLLLEKTQEEKEKKLRDAIQTALSSRPKDFSAYGPAVASALRWLARLMLKPN